MIEAQICAYDCRLPITTCCFKPLRIWLNPKLLFQLNSPILLRASALLVPDICGNRTGSHARKSSVEAIMMSLRVLRSESL